MANPVEVRLHERIRLLKEVIENVEGAELPRLPLVINRRPRIVTAAVAGLHAGPSRAVLGNVGNRQGHDYDALQRVFYHLHRRGLTANTRKQFLRNLLLIEVGLNLSSRPARLRRPTCRNNNRTSM